MCSFDGAICWKSYVLSAVIPLTTPSLQVLRITIGHDNVLNGAAANERIAIGHGAFASNYNQAVFGGDAIVQVQSGSSISTNLTSVVPAKDNAATLGTASFRWSTAYYGTAPTVGSDARIKTNLQPISLGLGTLMKLQPLTYFKHKSHFENGAVVLEADGTQEAGFLAQEVSPPVYRPEDETKALWGMRYEQVVSAVQELKAENDALKAKNEGLEARLVKIEKALGV